MSIEEIRPQVEAWRADGERYGVAVLTETWRSAPRKPGARFARSRSGEIAGNVSAGCVEADLAERLAGVLAEDPPSLVTYDVSDETAHGVGLACGGRIAVFLEARDPDEPIWPLLLENLDARSTCFLLTEMSSPRRGAHWLVAPNGEVLASDTARPAPEAAVEAGRRLLDTGGVQVVEADARVTGEDAEPAGDAAAAASASVLVEVFLPSRRLVVVGATPIGAALARLARTADIPVAVIEPRAGYAGALDDGWEVDGRWPDEALSARVPDRSTAVAVVAHDARLDVAALEAALRSAAGYVGLLGGGRTRRVRFEALREAGVDEAKIASVHAPIGLDIRAERPAEVALAILAEIVAVWRGAAPGTP